MEYNVQAGSWISSLCFSAERGALGTGEGTGRKVKMKGGQQEFMMLYKAL